VILVDANILLYAEDQCSPRHKAARQWWDAQLSGAAQVCLCWTILCAFIRISTSSRIFEHPLSIDQSVSRIQSWMNQPSVRLIHPTERHWVILRQLLIESRATANLVSDAHLATLAIEHNCELFSTDADFARFSKVKWRNPLKEM
jgi:hypothetical protein